MDSSVTACFTGHRPKKLGGYFRNDPVNVSICNELEKHIKNLYWDGYRNFITGMALGVDTWAAEIVIALRDSAFPDMKLICAIPFKNQSTRWPRASIGLYDRILEMSDGQVIVSTGPYSSEKMMIRNAWMVDHSTAVIAVWDGSNGGTGNCVRYAQKNDVQIFTIDPDTHKHGFDKLAHLATRDNYPTADDI